MKKLLLLLAVAFTLQTSAQTDSSALRCGKLGLRMGDWNFVGSTLRTYPLIFEDLTDSMKARIRPLSRVNYPANLTVITIDSLTNNEAYQLVVLLKPLYNKGSVNELTRIEAAVRAISPWATWRLNMLDDAENAAISAIKNIGQTLYQRKN